MIAVPFLVLLIVYQRLDWFKWLLALSFLTDIVDGYLARKYQVTSVMGSKIDSIADDLTIVVAIAGVFIYKPEFLKHEMTIIIIVFAVFIMQTIIAFIRYGKMTSFHTYAAKTAAMLQGVFLLLLFFLPEPVYILFYVTIIVSVIELLEEIILVFMLPNWETNVKGLWWVIKRKRK